MYIFFAATILIGIMCISLSLLILMIDRKKVDYLVESLDNKKEDLMEVINDAEQIVVEMNNFADYLFEKIDSKVSEINLVESKEVKPEVVVSVEPKEIEQPIPKAVGSEINHYQNQPFYSMAYKANSRAPKKEILNQNTLKAGNRIDIKLNEEALDYKEVYNFSETAVDYKETYNITKDKVIPLNPRYRDAYALFEQGYSELEIAKRLNMGLGEIKLIIGVKR